MCKSKLAVGSGVITSPGYPGFYLKNTDCTIRIQLTGAGRIGILFIEMDLEEPDDGKCNDYLQITKGIHFSGCKMRLSEVEI